MIQKRPDAGGHQAIPNPSDPLSTGNNYPDDDKGHSRQAVDWLTQETVAVQFALGHVPTLRLRSEPVLHRDLMSLFGLWLAYERRAYVVALALASVPAFAVAINLYLPDVIG